MQQQLLLHPRLVTERPVDRYGRSWTMLDSLDSPMASSCSGRGSNNGFMLEADEADDAHAAADEGNQAAQSLPSASGQSAAEGAPIFRSRAMPAAGIRSGQTRSRRSAWPERPAATSQGQGCLHTASHIGPRRAGRGGHERGRAGTAAGTAPR
jgi:hypothetical protein